MKGIINEEEILDNKKLFGFTPKKGTCELIKVNLNVNRKLIEL